MGRSAHLRVPQTHILGDRGPVPPREPAVGRRPAERRRPRPRRARDRRSRQAFARMRAWLIVATHREPLGVTVDGDAVETRLLLVANNAYALELPSLGERERLDEGVLHLYLVQGGVDERTGTRFEVDVPGGRIRAAIDGEPEVLQTPIRFTIEPRALRVLVPKGV